MLKDLNYNSSSRACIIRKITTIAIRTIYYIFCRRKRLEHGLMIIIIIKTFIVRHISSGLIGA